MFFVTRRDGMLDVWDYTDQQNDPVLSQQARDCPFPRGHSLQSCFTPGPREDVALQHAGLGPQQLRLLA